MPISIGAASAIWAFHVLVQLAQSPASASMTCEPVLRVEAIFEPGAACRGRGRQGEPPDESLHPAARGPPDAGANTPASAGLSA